MMDVQEAMTEKVLLEEKIKNLMQLIILRKEGKVRSPQRIENLKFLKIWRTWKLICQSKSQTRLLCG